MAKKIKKSKRKVIPISHKRPQRKEEKQTQSRERQKSKTPLKESREDTYRPKIRVIGIGGGGGNIASEVSASVPRIDFWAANTDMQALSRIRKTCHRFLFGQELTHGLGCGGNARLGSAAAKQAKEKIEKLFQGVDFCILLSCLGGGTGSGAVSEFAALAKKAGCLSLGIFTLPFHFEGEKRMQIAKQALLKTTPLLSASVIFPNEKIFQILDQGLGFQSALAAVNAMLANDLKNLMDVLYAPGLVNIDFADLRSILEGEGKFAYLASAGAQGENRAETALKALLSHPLNVYDPRGAERILFNISADKGISIAEIQSISSVVSALNPKAKIIFGISNQPRDKNSLILTLLATGKTEGSIQKEGKKKNARSLKQSSPNAEVPSIEDSPQEPKRKAEPSKKNASPKNKAVKEEKKPVPKGPGSHTEVPSPNTRNFNVGASVKATRASPKVKIKVKKITGKQKAAKQESKLSQQLNKIRKNALDIRKEIELAERKQQDEEQRWDIPAFLRRNVNL